MKAKEYAERILSSKDEESRSHAIRETFDDLVQEIGKIAQARRIQTDKALAAIIKEQKQKWTAICRIVNKEHQMLDEDGFIELLSRVIPETKRILSHS